MGIKENIDRWRSLPEAEKLRIRRAWIPRSVARSMAFEGEPVDQKRLEEYLRQITQAPPDTSKPAEES